MQQDQVIAKVKTATEALLSLMGVYYFCLINYPQQANGALLFNQERVLRDSIHPKHKITLKKATKAMDDHKEEEVKKDLFD